MMLMKHKLLTLKKLSLTADQKNGLFEPLVNTYCGLFRQVVSLTFDLGPYLFYLNDFHAGNKPDAYSRSSLLSDFLTERDNQTDPLR